MCWQDDGNPYQQLHDANKAIDSLNITIRKLESEADWLAEKLAKMCNNVWVCPADQLVDVVCTDQKCGSVEPKDWRRAARKAMEEKCQPQ